MNGFAWVALTVAFLILMRVLEVLNDVRERRRAERLEAAHLNLNEKLARDRAARYRGDSEFESDYARKAGW